ncbi:unnamed protein product [Mycena citricolor]|uniref:Uncharacterized protein n=1 Tax=Mycena citricolor TaxID=2018698 RepID=A0AAD2JU93_9AGAR|nr:unnamed protein product [Mycena citricolor]
MFSRYKCGILASTSQVVNRKLRQDRVATVRRKSRRHMAPSDADIWVVDEGCRRHNGGPRWPRRRRLRSWLSSAIKVGPVEKIAEFLKAACWLTFDPHTPVQPSDQCTTSLIHVIQTGNDAVCPKADDHPADLVVYFLRRVEQQSLGRRQ